MTATRQEHLEFCKRRALEYVDTGDIQQAFSSMASDLDKHDELANHPGKLMGMNLMLIDELSTSAAMRKWIEGFN